jgi:hypothetical protein
MKHCPRCQKNYEADDLNFCLDDGTPLITGVSPAAPTIAMQGSTATATPGHNPGTMPYVQAQPYAAQQPVVRPRMKIWPFVLIGLAILLCGGGLGGIFIFSKLYTTTGSRGPEPPAASPSVEASPATAGDHKAGGGRITIENFNKLKTGMSRSEVEALLGKGEQVSSISGGGHTYSVDSWIDEDFRSIILTFDNDKLSTKTQSGLDD